MLQLWYRKKEKEHHIESKSIKFGTKICTHLRPSRWSLVYQCDRRLINTVCRKAVLRIFSIVVRNICVIIPPTSTSESNVYVKTKMNKRLINLFLNDLSIQRATRSPIFRPKLQAKVKQLVRFKASNSSLEKFVYLF